MVKDWYLKVEKAAVTSLPQKYFDGTYIEHRECSDTFSEEDINENFDYLGDVLPGQISCKWREQEKNYKLSAGEYRTISMIEISLELQEKFRIVRILLMAYFHDLDPIFTRCLPGKTMGKLHRLTTWEKNTWKSPDIQNYYGFWRNNCKKYLPLSDSNLKSIEDELMSMSPEDRIGLFESEDLGPFVEHFCRIIELAFGTKAFSLKTFSLEACEAALDYLEERDAEK